MIKICRVLVSQNKLSSEDETLGKFWTLIILYFSVSFLCEKPSAIKYYTVYNIST
jgi:hypothetical protein